MSYKLTTVNGYDFFECSSALQKSIRRGNEEEAMYWAVELFNSNFSEYVWKRLKIMCSEDVGLADNFASILINSLYAHFVEQKKKKDEKNQPERLFLTHAVMYMCRCPKSRLIDWALIHFWKTHVEGREVPDYAFDKHNQRGRSMKRGWDHFFDEGTLLSNHAPQPHEDEYKRRARESLTEPTDDPNTAQATLF